MLDYFKSASERMMLDFQESSKINHTGVKGRAREKSIIHQFLSPYLPSRYSLSSGVIIDKSRQQDIIIYDNFCSPLLKDLEDEKLFFPESVLVSLEVKSSLDKTALEDCQKKAESIYQLSYSSNPTISLTSNLVLDSTKPPILCTAFAFDSPKNIDALRDDFREIKKNSSISNALSFIVVLNDKDGNSGIIIHSNGKNLNEIIMLPNRDSRLAVLKNEDRGSTLLHMYLYIMHYFQMVGLFVASPNYLSYAESAGLSKNNISIAREDLDGATVVHEGERLFVNDAFTMSGLVKKLFESGLNDEEAMEYILTMVRLPKMNFILSPNTRFYEVHPTNKEMMRKMDLPSPIEIIKSIKAIKNNISNDNDQEVFRKYKSMIDRIGSKELTIEIR